MCINTDYIHETVFDILLDVCSNSEECDLVFDLFGLEFNQIFHK